MREERTPEERLQVSEGKEGKMQMSFMKPTTQQTRSTTNYNKIGFEVLEKDIHPIDQIELHK